MEAADAEEVEGGGPLLLCSRGPQTNAANEPRLRFSRLQVLSVRPRGTRSMRHSIAAAVLTVVAAGGATPAAAGPGFGSLSYTAAEMGQPVAVFDRKNGAEDGTNVPLFVGGYLMLPFAPDSGKPGGGIAIYDVSNPRLPVLMTTVKDAHTAVLRENHSLPIARIAGREVVVLQAATGIQLWDLTDPLTPTFLSELALEGASGGDYANAAWWTSWQGRWIFVSGLNNGLYVVDAADPAAPRLATRLPTSATGGFLLGPVFAMGDRLVYSDTNGIFFYRYGLLDITDPSAPFLRTTKEGTLMQLYASTVLGDRIYGIGRAEHLHVVSWANDTLEMVADIPGMGAASYGSLQDEVLHYGGKDYYQKVDLTDERAPVVVQKITVDRPDTDHGQAWAFGNLVYIGNDHGTGSVLTPHAAEPDTRSPTIVRTYPSHRANFVATTSRISISFSDNLDFSSIDPTTISIATSDGQPVDGIFSYWSNTVHFGPAMPWQADREYRITIAAGGVRDVVGNAVVDATVVEFSTGQGPPGFGVARPDAGGGAVMPDPGCGCRVGGSHGAGTGLLFTVLAVAAVLLRRRPSRCG